MSLDSQAAYFAQYVAPSRLTGPSLELPIGTVAVYRADLPTPNQNDQPYTSGQLLNFGTGTTSADGTLTTFGGTLIRTPYLTGTDASKAFDVVFTLIDAGPGTGDSSLALFSVGAEDDLDAYAKLTLSADPVGQRSLVLNAFDKGVSGGVTAKLPAGLGLGGVHSFWLKVSPDSKQLTLMHLGSLTAVTVTLNTYSWTGKLCMALGGAYRGLQGTAGNRTPRGAEKFLEARSVGFALVARTLLTSEAQDAASILVGTYRHPTITVQPATAFIRAGDAATTFRATLENSEANPVWTLTGPGTLTLDGLNVIYTPPGSISATSTAIIRAQAVGGNTFESVITLSPAGSAGTPVINSFTALPANVTAGGEITLAWNVAGATSLTDGDGVALSPVTSGSVKRTPYSDTTYILKATNSNGTVTAQATVTVTGSVTVNSYSYDPNFRESALVNGQSDLYRRAIDGALGFLDTGKVYVHGASNPYWNDANANTAGRPNTAVMNFLLALYTQTKAPELIGIMADRIELNINAMRALGQGTPPPSKYYPEGKGRYLLALEQEAYYDKLVTVENDDGTTFQTSWLTMPKPLFVRKTTAATQEGKTASGADCNPHDLTPRLSGYVALLMVLDQNRNYNRGAGKESVASLCDWGYDWFYKYLAFYRYRANNSVEPDFKGLGRFRDGMIDWKEDIAHDFIQHLYLDFMGWEWARLREGPASPRAVFWENSYRKRLSWIELSINYAPTPNGKETAMFGHHLAKPQMSWRSKSQTAAYTNGGWFARYSADLYHCINVMTLLGAPGMRRLAEALANNFSQVGWISNTRLSTRIAGPGNKFTDGSDIPYSSPWPAGLKLTQPSTKFYEYVTTQAAVTPVDQADSLASLQNRFRETQGFELVAFDPTPDKENLKRYYEIAKIYLNYTPLRGQTVTKNDDNWCKRQVIDFITSRRFGVDPKNI